MNNQVLEQLKQVTATELEYDKNTVSIFIPKTIKIFSSAVKIGSVYIIELKDTITNPSPNSTLASNWNNGVIPKYSKYIVEVLNVVAKMIKVNGVAVEDNSSSFCGWLPNDGFEVITKI